MIITQIELAVAGEMNGPLVRILTSGPCLATMNVNYFIV